MTRRITGYQYVVVCPAIMGSVDDWRTVYSSDGKPFQTRVAAVNHGWSVYGHDDWLLAVIHKGRVVCSAWMDEDRDEPEERKAMAQLLGLR